MKVLTQLVLVGFSAAAALVSVNCGLATATLEQSPGTSTPASSNATPGFQKDVTNQERYSLLLQDCIDKLVDAANNGVPPTEQEIADCLAKAGVPFVPGSIDAGVATVPNIPGVPDLGDLFDGGIPGLDNIPGLTQCAAGCTCAAGETCINPLNAVCPAPFAICVMDN